MSWQRRTRLRRAQMIENRTAHTTDDLGTLFDAGPPACSAAPHTYGERVGSLGRFSFLERQLLIAFCRALYARSITELGNSYG